LSTIKKKQIRQRQVNTGNVEERPKGVLPIIIGKEEIGLASVKKSLAIQDGMVTALNSIDKSIQKTATSLMIFQKLSSLSLNVSEFEKMGRKLNIINDDYKEVWDSVAAVEKKQKDLSKTSQDNEKKIKKLKDTWKSFVGGLDKMGIAHNP
jgi:predicted  nucleic acid-binding Zn-ribbon protein